MLLKLIFGGLFKRNTSEAKKFKKFTPEAQRQMLEDWNEKN